MSLNFSNNLPVLKENLVRQISSTACLRDLNLNKLKNSESEYRLHEALQDIAVDVTIDKIDKNNEIQLEFYNKLKCGQFIPLAWEQLCRELDIKKGKILIALSKILSVEDTDPNVLKIKEELMQNYGVESLYLNNEVELAQKWLETAKVLKQHNIPLPKEIICSRYLLGIYVSPYCIALPNSNENHTVIINPDSLEENDFGLSSSSTKSPLHILVHECIHCIQPGLLAFQLKKIPAELKNVANNLSSYAKGNYTAEIHAELLTKKVLDKLSPEEEELLQYLGGTWLA